MSERISIAKPTTPARVQEHAEFRRRQPRGAKRPGLREAFGRFKYLLAVTITLASCSDTELLVPSTESRLGAVKAWEANAAVYWNGVARDFVVANSSPPPVALRGYTIVSVAQYNAAVAAASGKDRNVHPSIRAAIGAASVEALSYLYPAQAAALENLLEEFLGAPAWPGEKHRDVPSGVAIGRVIGQEVVAHAQTDNFFAPGMVTVPVGPGLWFSGSPPVGALWGQARTYTLLSGDQFRPPPPPAFGSAEFEAALAEVRLISDTRTPAQEANAKFWDFPVGTYTSPGYWNEEAARLAVKYHLGDREAAHVLALMNMVAFDAIVASHDAKYFYWVLRPSMADPAIEPVIVLPNFPSYPANHATISGGMARILAREFPAEKQRLDALAEEAAMSRLLGGIHYRFDGDAGLLLGRAIAAWAIEHDVHGHQAIVLR